MSSQIFTLTANRVEKIYIVIETHYSKVNIEVKNNYYVRLKISIQSNL